ARAVDQALYFGPSAAGRTDRARYAVVFYRRVARDAMGPRRPRAGAGLVERVDHDCAAGLRGAGRFLADPEFWPLGCRCRGGPDHGTDAGSYVRRLVGLRPRDDGNSLGLRRAVRHRRVALFALVAICVRAAADANPDPACARACGADHGRLGLPDP